MNPNSLCPGCMKEIPDIHEVCPYCGYLANKHSRNISVLPDYTILKGRYLTGKPLGEGGFGITYLAMDLQRQKPVAIKEYFPVNLVSRDTGRSLKIRCCSESNKRKIFEHGLDCFIEEANNLMKFRSLSGVVSVKDFFSDNGTAYLVMEYLDGITLKQYLDKRQRPVQEKVVLNVMRPVLSSLAEIHKAGVIHRDISPENIMLTRNGRVVLIDFGAARTTTGAETKTLTIILKRGYAPVEQYQSRGRQGPWTDIYALCATMYTMLSGTTPLESMERMMNDTLVPLKRLRLEEASELISARLSDVIERGMAVQPNLRYQNAREILKLLYPQDAPEPELGSEPEPELEDNSEPMTSEKRVVLIIFMVLGILLAFWLTMAGLQQIIDLL